MKAFRIQIVIAVVVLICGVSLMGLVYMINNKPIRYVTPGVIVTAPSPVATPIQPISSGISRFTRTNYHPHYTTPVMSRPTLPNVGSQPIQVFRTSKAQVQHAGGGGMGVAGASNGQNNGSSSKGIQYSSATATMPMTNFLALADARQMATPEAADAPSMARLASEPRQAPGPPTGPTDPSHQLIEQPIGEPWILAIMALLYAIGRFVADKKQKRTA